MARVRAAIRFIALSSVVQFEELDNAEGENETGWSRREAKGERR
jgi:hypothetical protein